MRWRGTPIRRPSSSGSAVSSAYDAVRKGRRRLRHEIRSLPEGQARDAAPWLPKEIEDRDLRAAILGAIARLPRRQATAVLLHIVEEQSYEESPNDGLLESTSGSTSRAGRAGLAGNCAPSSRALPPGRSGREEGGVMTERNSRMWIWTNS